MNYGQSGLHNRDVANLRWEFGVVALGVQGNRPVDKVQINIVKAKLLQGSVETGFNIAVVGAP